MVNDTFTFEGITTSYFLLLQKVNCNCILCHTSCKPSLTFSADDISNTKLQIFYYLALQISGNFDK